MQSTGSQQAVNRQSLSHKHVLYSTGSTWKIHAVYVKMALFNSTTCEENILRNRQTGVKNRWHYTILALQAGQTYRAFARQFTVSQARLLIYYVLCFIDNDHNGIMVLMWRKTTYVCYFSVFCFFFTRPKHVQKVHIMSLMTIKLSLSWSFWQQNVQLAGYQPCTDS